MAKGKSIADDIISGLESVTKKWSKQRRAEERHSAARANRNRRMIRSHRISEKDIAWGALEAAYLKASANGTLPANCRQIYYAARPVIQQQTGKQHEYAYFQVLLSEYVQENDPDWDIVYDDRGHFCEPHTERTLGLGTLNVRNYLKRIRDFRLADATLQPATIETYGPHGCYNSVLFMEKEGFGPLLERVNLAERYDIGVMSTKGLSVTAARRLVDQVCGANGIPCLVLHDFDKSGFSILGTLGRDSPRYQYEHDVKFIDLGLRIGDIEGLQTEAVFDRGSKTQREYNLRQNGATPLEAQFLLNQRVELNAMTSDQLVAFIERKLKQHGIRKIVPDKDELVEAYRLFDRGRRIEEAIKEAIKEIYEDDEVEVPADLSKKVRKLLAKKPTWRWDQAVASLVGASAPKLSLEQEDQKPDQEEVKPSPKPAGDVIDAVRAVLVMILPTCVDKQTNKQD